MSIDHEKQLLARLSDPRACRAGLTNTAAGISIVFNAVGDHPRLAIPIAAAPSDPVTETASAKKRGRKRTGSASDDPS